MRGIVTGAAVFALLIGLLAACGRGGARSTETPTPRQTLEAASDRMAQIKTVSFDLTHARGATPLLPGIVAREITGHVAVPDKAKVQVDAVASVFSAALQIQIIMSGGRAFLTDPLTGAWQEADPATIPFTFVTLPTTLAEIVKAIQAPVLAGDDTVDGAPSTIIKGSIQSQDLSGLLPTASEGLPVDIQVWIGRSDSLVRRAQIDGRIRDEEPDGIVRVLRFYSFDQPVEITLPQ